MLKEKLLKNKKINEDTQYDVAVYHSKLSYRLGEHGSDIEPINYEELFNPFIKTYSDIQLKLQNGTSSNPTQDRKKSDKIQNSVVDLAEAIENVTSNTDIWEAAVQRAGLMGGVDLMGTPVSRYKSLTIFSGNLPGSIRVKAVDDDIYKLAYEIYDEFNGFVERIFIDKLNELSEKQDLFVSIPTVMSDIGNFKMSSDIFQSKQMGEEKVLTGGVTEVYQKKKEDGKLDIYQRPLSGNLVQDFVKIDKETIGDSLQFNLEMDKISAGLLGEYESFDQVIAFNNNILSTVTNYYIEPVSVLKENAQNKFQDDFKEWFLATEIGSEMPVGDPYAKNIEKNTEQESIEQTQQVVDELDPSLQP